MKKLFFIIFVLLFSVSAWADHLLMQPIGDRGWTQWTVYPSGDRWDAFDDTTANEDVNYIYAISDEGEGWYQPNFTGGDDIDSVTLIARVKSVATTGTPQVIMGRLAFVASEWGWCVPYDTLDLTSSYALDSITWLTNPAGGDWNQAELNNTNRAWGFGNLTIGTVVDSFGNPDGQTQQALTTGYISAFRYQADFTGDVDSLTIEYYDPSVHGDVKMGIYSDSGTYPDSGYPYARLDTTAPQAVTNGCNRLGLITGGVSVSEDTYYWILFRVSETGDKTRYDTGPYADCGYYRSCPYSDEWPATAPTDMTGEQKQYPLQGIGTASAQNRVTQAYIRVFYAAAAAEGQIIIVH